MNFRLFVVLTLLTSFSASSYANTNSYNCRDLYEVAINAQVKAVRRAAVSNLILGSSTTILGQIGLAIAGVISPVGLIANGAALAVKGASVAVKLSTDTTLEKVESLEEKTKKQEKLARQVSNDVGVEVTADDVLAAVATGIEDGTFCQNFPDLYDLKDIKEFLSNKYQQ